MENIIKDIIATEEQAKSMQAQASKQVAEIMAELSSEVEAMIETSAVEIKTSTKVELDKISAHAEKLAGKQLASDVEEMKIKIAEAEKNMDEAIKFITEKVMGN